jgi:hypothetical protein
MTGNTGPPTYPVVRHPAYHRNKSLVGLYSLSGGMHCTAFGSGHTTRNVCRTPWTVTVNATGNALQQRSTAATTYDFGSIHVVLHLTDATDMRSTGRRASSRRWPARSESDVTTVVLTVALLFAHRLTEWFRKAMIRTGGAITPPSPTHRFDSETYKHRFLSRRSRDLLLEPDSAQRKLCSYHPVIPATSSAQPRSMLSEEGTRLGGSPRLHGPSMAAEASIHRRAA